jgi:transposase
METIALSVLTRDEMEQRRLQAAADLQGGISQSAVARKFGVSRTTASRWCRVLNGDGLDALRKRRAPGRPCRLTPEQFREVAAIYKGGPGALGFNTERWTTARFADAIFARFGVRYDPDHAGRIMHRLGLRQRVASAHRHPAATYISRYSPNTALSRSEVSPTLA